MKESLDENRGPTNYKVCSRCIMDTSDPEITFDSAGECNHCKRLERLLALIAEPSNERLIEMVNKIKKQGRNKEYDCIIGVSGGMDSTFIAYKVKELGLRPLAVHVDNGWDSELAVKNIEQTLERCGIDLYTFVLDWEEFRNLQKSFLLASTPDAEIPTDHAIMAVLLKKAASEGIKYIVSGHNMRTEGILPYSFSYGAFDWKYIRNVHKQFGSVKLKSFPHFTFFDRVSYVFLQRVRCIHLLNYINYNREEVMEILEKELGWKYYGGKHYESNYTRFFQAYILPTKFNVDKRRAHLSTLIVSGQITRADALKRIEAPPYPPDELRNDLEYTVKKLGMTLEEFGEMMSAPKKSFKDYPNNWNFLKRTKFIVNALKQIGMMPRRVGI